MRNPLLRILEILETEFSFLSWQDTLARAACEVVRKGLFLLTIPGSNPSQQGSHSSSGLGELNQVQDKGCAHACAQWALFPPQSQGMPRKWCYPHSVWVFLAPLSKSHALRAIWGREFFKEILFPDDSRLYQKWEMKWTLTETLTLPSLSHVVKHSVKEYYCSDQDQWRFAQQQQNKLLFFFPAFWFALNTIRFVDRQFSAIWTPLSFNP